MSLVCIPYEGLESKILDPEHASLVFGPGDRIDVRLGRTEGKYSVVIVMPWKNIYGISAHDTLLEARKRYDECLDQLKQGYGIHITSNHTAEIVKPSSK